MASLRQDDPAILSIATALALISSFSAIYVLPLYTFNVSKPSPLNPRDSPRVIQARIKIVTTSVFTSLILAVAVLIVITRESIADSIRRLGLGFPTVDSLGPVWLVFALFAGPIYETVVFEEKWKSLLSPRQWYYGRLQSVFFWRNYIIGPATEEITFRSLSLPILLLSPLSTNSALLISPLPFGVAHVHHLYESHLTYPSTPISALLVGTILQFSYTTLFGWFASFCLFRTGSVWGVILAHSLCNSLGLPRVYGFLENGLGNASTRATITYYVFLIGGIWAFYHNLWAWTESPDNLARL